MPKICFFCLGIFHILWKRYLLLYRRRNTGCLSFNSELFFLCIVKRLVFSTVDEINKHAFHFFFLSHQHSHEKNQYIFSENLKWLRIKKKLFSSEFLSKVNFCILASFGDQKNKWKQDFVLRLYVCWVICILNCKFCDSAHDLVDY